MKFINSNNNTVDGFRFIENLHTTARQLFICSQIVKEIGSRQLPETLVSQILINWSTQEESQNEFYRSRKGKLTEGGKKTTALNHYLDLCSSLGLVSSQNKFYSNSRLGYLLIYFTSDRKGITIGESEKIFFLFQLFNLDADGIILAMQILERFENGRNQLELQNAFKDSLNERLLIKREFTPQTIKELIGEKYKNVNFNWKNPVKYAEHILIPRCEWLADLGIINISKEGSSTKYFLTAKGKNLLKAIPVIQNGTIKDISEYWLYSSTFKIFSILLKDRNETMSSFQSLNTELKTTLLGESLKNAMNVVKTSNSFKISLFDSLLFICIEHFVKKNIITEFEDIILELENGLAFGGRFFVLSEVGRLNESYITSRIDA